jgi:hypothetical protein
VLRAGLSEGAGCVSSASATASARAQQAARPRAAPALRAFGRASSESSLARARLRALDSQARSLAASATAGRAPVEEDGLLARHGHVVAHRVVADDLALFVHALVVGQALRPAISSLRQQPPAGRTHHELGVLLQKHGQRDPVMAQLVRADKL